MLLSGRDEWRQPAVLTTSANLSADDLCGQVLFGRSHRNRFQPCPHTGRRDLRRITHVTNFTLGLDQSTALHNSGCIMKSGICEYHAQAHVITNLEEP